MIMNLNLLCHDQCVRRDCMHPFVVDFSKHPNCKSRFTERPCGLQCTKHETKKPFQKKVVKTKGCKGEFFGIKNQA